MNQSQLTATAALQGRSYIPPSGWMVINSLLRLLWAADKPQDVGRSPQQQRNGGGVSVSWCNRSIRTNLHITFTHTPSRSLVVMLISKAFNKRSEYTQDLCLMIFKSVYSAKFLYLKGLVLGNRVPEYIYITHVKTCRSCPSIDFHKAIQHRKNIVELL